MFEWTETTTGVEFITFGAVAVVEDKRITGAAKHEWRVIDARDRVIAHGASINLAGARNRALQEIIRAASI